MTDELGECIECRYYDVDEETCKNRNGAYYLETSVHWSDTGCDKWKPWKGFEEWNAPHIEHQYIPNAWDEWKRKQALKGLYTEHERKVIR